jgi:hypothetical protein
MDIISKVIAILIFYLTSSLTSIGMSSSLSNLDAINYISPRSDAEYVGICFILSSIS